MTSKEFVIWLKGFSKAANEYNITPKQWEAIVEQLEKVEDSTTTVFPFGVANTSTSLEYPEGTTISYTTKQQLND
jgi:hypothetical protein